MHIASIIEDINIDSDIKVEDFNFQDVADSPNQNVYFIVQNIRSLRKNFDNLLLHIQSFHKQPDLIFLTEVWVFDNEVDLYRIPGYKCLYCLNNSYAAGGVCVFVKDEFDCSSCRISSLSSDILKLNCSIFNKNFVFYCIYRIHDKQSPDFLLMKYLAF
jgi:hypothetical protein